MIHNDKILHCTFCILKENAWEITFKLKLFGKYSYVDFTAKSGFILKLILDLKITAHFTVTSKFPIL